MEILVSIIVCLIVVSTVAWGVLFRRRYAPNLESLLNQMRRPAQCEVGPGQVKVEEQRSRDDELWEAIHGARGIYRMFHNAGILVTLATRMSEESGEGSEQHDHISDLALSIRWLTFRCLVIEWPFINVLPEIPIPRFIARFAFDQYCELCASVRAMIEFRHPSLVDNFDKVI